MERREKSICYFKGKLSELVEQVYSPERVLPKECLLNRMRALRGAVQYAFEMGDIDAVRRRVLLDEIDRLKREVCG